VDEPARIASASDGAGSEWTIKERAAIQASSHAASASAAILATARKTERLFPLLL
jgi:hypothetical protein